MTQKILIFSATSLNVVYNRFNSYKIIFRSAKFSDTSKKSFFCVDTNLKIILLD